MIGQSRLGRGALYLAAASLGALLAQGLAPAHQIWAVPLSLFGLGLIVLRLTLPVQGALTGWIFGTAYFAAAMFWIIEPFQVDAERYAWMAPFALAFLAAGLALFWMLAFWAAIRLGSGPGTRIFALTVTWSLAELARAYLFTGLPWAAFGQFWIDTPLAAGLAWIGPQGLAVLTLATCLPLALAAAPGVSRSIRMAAVAPLAGMGLFATLLPPVPATIVQNPEKNVPIVRLIQPNAPQDQKWHPDHYLTFFFRQLDYTGANSPDRPRPDLVVWPETSVPGLLENAEDYFSRIAEAAQGVPVVLGIQRRDDARYFNSLVYLDENAAVSGRYDKHHLVPFGEYVPFGDLMARFGIYGFAAREGAGFSPGPGPGLLIMDPIGKALPLICYEAVFPQLVNASPERPDVLVQITNDAWFGTYSGPFQHLVQARMRAIEQGLPLIRVANTGVSAMIDAHGRLTRQIPLGQAGFVDAALPSSLPPTLYSRTGDWPVLVGLLLVLGWLRTRHGRIPEPAKTANMD